VDITTPEPVILLFYLYYMSMGGVITIIKNKIRRRKSPVIPICYSDLEEECYNIEYYRKLNPHSSRDTSFEKMMKENMELINYINKSWKKYTEIEKQKSFEFIIRKRSDDLLHLFTVKPNPLPQ
jgi:hypothetical protein